MQQSIEERFIAAVDEGNKQIANLVGSLPLVTDRQRVAFDIGIQLDKLINLYHAMNYLEKLL